MDDLTNESQRAVRDSYTVNVLQPQQQQKQSDAASIDSVNDDHEKDVLLQEYNRRHFTPKHKDMITPMEQSGSKSPPWKVFAVKTLSPLPKVNTFIFSIAPTWNIVAVFASYGLSLLIPKDDKEGRARCSAIDIEWSMLRNVGRVLFTILSSRASDAIGRYDDSKRTLGAVCTNVTEIAMDIVHSFPSGRFHRGDKERLIAHLIQIPLGLRDKLLADHHHRHHHRQNSPQHSDDTSSIRDTPF